ncbi:MAG: hypothetical protein M3139_06760 [Bacteroidota bacterium]|nr:hypothetical protein [Bacteroidota bacterium]
MKQFNNLSTQEKKALLSFPAYISLLAANNDGMLDKSEKKSAIKFSHIKTYSSDPLLAEFYKEADKVFKRNIEELDEELPGEDEQRESVIKNELLKLEKIVLKLGQDYASTMHRSMNSFKDHVSKAHHNVLMDLLFPLAH